MLVACVLHLALLAAPDASADPDLLALLEAPFVTVEDLDSRLAQLDAYFEAQNDMRGVFVAVYGITTADTAQSIAEGAFLDAAWLADLTIVFGNLYRKALYDYECGNVDAVPEPWRIAFDAAQDPDVPTLKHAILGIHAHINHDLALAIAAVTPAHTRDTRMLDFYLMDTVLDTAIDPVQDMLAERYEEGLARLDTQFESLDELVIARTINAWRHRAWRVARWFDASRPPQEIALAEQILEFRVGAEARVLRGKT
jgi:hypothetical protein